MNECAIVSVFAGTLQQYRRRHVLTLGLGSYMCTNSHTTVGVLDRSGNGNDCRHSTYISSARFECADWCSSLRQARFGSCSRAPQTAAHRAIGCSESVAIHASVYVSGMAPIHIVFFSVSGGTLNSMCSRCAITCFYIYAKFRHKPCTDRTHAAPTTCKCRFQQQSVA